MAYFGDNAIHAWVNFNGGGASNSTPSIRDDYNVSSLGDVSTSTFNIYFDTDFANTNYAWSGSAGYDNYSQQNWVSSPSSTAYGSWKQASMLQIIAVYNNNTSPNRGPDDFNIIAIGDSA